MNFWEKMKSNIADKLNSKTEEPDLLYHEILIASEELQMLLLQCRSGQYITKESICRYHNKWGYLYSTVKNRKKSILPDFGSERKKKFITVSQFLHDYESIEKQFSEYNELNLKEMVSEANELIQPVEEITLDEQQMRCICKNEKNHLVLAGAGTGKTTTIIGYVKYLIKKGLCSSDEILLLSFTNASATEMSKRLQKELNCTFDAMTFHKLGMNIITLVEGKKPDIYEKDIRYFVKKELVELIKQPAYLISLCDYLSFYDNRHKSEFEFTTKGEYELYLSNNPPVTLNKERVKSYGEVDIANFLRQNGIAYQYEMAYPMDTATEEYGQYHPDFYLTDYDIYIEYFGIDENGEVPSYFQGKNGMSPTETYQAGMRWKRNLHKKNNTKLKELYAYEKKNETLVDRLRDHLKKAGVNFEPLSEKEIWDELSGTSSQKLDRISELFATIINLIKSNNCTIDDIRARDSLGLNSNRRVLDLVEPVFNHYQEVLKERNSIDFNDMINCATEYVNRGKYRHSFKYVIVDEYQDISQARYKLLKAMRDQNDYRLFCVGDDWQSIYRFSGSDIGFIIHFEKYWGTTEISKIETTYRFSQSLIDISSSFVMKNDEQKKKDLKSLSEENKFALGIITGYNERYAVQFMTANLDELPENSSVFFLGRYRFDIRMLDGNGLFSYQYNNIIGKTIVKYQKRLDLKIQFLTVHGAKGLQADYVYILNNRLYGMGFPSNITEAPVLRLLLDNCDHYPFAEERRLFYVALTRAKKKVWLLTMKDNESIFVKEMRQMYGKQIDMERYTCPLCGGKIIKRNGPYGTFLGCSNYRTQGCKFKRKLN